MNLPHLRGSPKQLDWMLPIREDIAGQIYAICADEERLHPDIPLLDAFAMAMRWHDNAKWWIEHHQGMVPFDILSIEIEQTAHDLCEQRASVRFVDPELVIFDLEGTLTSTPFRDESYELLYGRREHCIELLCEGVKLAVATNQGGVAFGIGSEQDAETFVRWACKRLGIPYYQICFGHPDAPEGFEQYRTPEVLQYRKPNPGMLLNILKHYQVPASRTLVVGDMLEDRGAAKNAGCHFLFTQEYFKTQDTLVVYDAPF